MSALDRLACALGTQSEVPNQELAKELARAKDTQSIAELANNLWSKDKAVSHDCIKVLYEIGYIAPELIRCHTQHFLRLISGKDNRLVWGGMIALGTVAAISADELFLQRGVILSAMRSGSVITVDNAIVVLSAVAAASAQYNCVVFPDLVEHLRTCRPKEVPQHAESIFVAVTAENRQAYLDVLETRLASLSEAQSKRVNRLIKKANALV